MNFYAKVRKFGVSTKQMNRIHQAPPWNSSIFTQTFGINRSRLNGDLYSLISGYLNNNLSGYMGLGSGGVNSAE